MRLARKDQERTLNVQKRYLRKSAIILILIPAVFLQCCVLPTPKGPAQQGSGTPLETEGPPHEAPPDVLPQTPGEFTLRYDPNASLNPITTLNRDSILLSSLLYESLFVLDGSLNTIPLLCANWFSEDNTVFTFEIKPDIAMSDGTLLTAEDVVYSIRQAMARGRFVNRLRTISAIAVAGDLTVSIGLQSPNNRFISLLDIPIIKSGSIDSSVPPGTGPFILAGADQLRLDAFTGHRDFFQLPVSSIRLISCTDSELTELFDGGQLSVLWEDPFDTFDLRLNRLRDTRYYDTTSLLYIGFNSNHIALRYPDVRRAISVSIDRQDIVEDIMGGHALPSPLALSPAFHLYDEEWEHRNLPPLREMAELLVRTGLEDFNDDTFLELSDGLGGYREFTINFIVNSENIHKVQVAHAITNTLRRNGLNVTVRELTWERFLNALRTGDFDMYLGETALGADFNLTPLLLPGALNYGKTADAEHYRPFIESFLMARSDDGIRSAAKDLINEIMFNAPYAPILYKKYAIYSPIGAIFAANPSQSGAFHNFAGWTINQYMLT